MKKVFAAVMAMVLCIGLVGCAGGGAPEEPTAEPTATPIPYADAEFIGAMKEALQARWQISDTKTNAELLEMESADYVEFMQKSINTELGVVDAYPNKLYMDVKLQNIAKKYVESLNAQLGALKYHSADWAEFNNKWTTAYDERTKLILTLSNEYGLTVDEKYQRILDELSTNAQVVVEKEEKEDAVAAIADQVDFRRVESEEDYGWPEYETVLENTTAETIAHYNLEVSLLDADDVIIGAAYCNSVNNWKPGAKAKLSFTTDEEFTKLEWTAVYYVE